MLTIVEQAELDPAAKTGEWADRIVSDYRRHMQPLVDPEAAALNMKYLLNQQPNTLATSMFKDFSKTGISPIKLAAVEKVKNILIAERDKAGIFIGLNCLDPTILDEKRKKDRDLLANRKNIEALMSTLNAKIGEPPFKLQNKLFNGNIETFEEIGLDPEEDEDVNYYMAAHWRMNVEIKAELPINYYFRNSEIETFLNFWCHDIMAKKAIAMMTYVNQNTGAIDHKYLTPESVKGVFGQRRDLKDSKCLSYTQNLTIEQFIRHMGNEFDPSRDYEQIINGINFQYATGYTALTGRGGESLYKVEGLEPEAHRYCDWNSFVNYKVPLGYIEFKTTDATAFKAGYSIHGNKKRLPIKFSTEVTEDSHYQKEVLFNEVTYKCYFLPTSEYSQRLYRFGKLYHQTVEGGEDELSNFSIIGIKEGGPPAMEVIMPYVDMIQQAWKKFEWIVRKAKPKGRSYNYESLVQIATKMIATGSQKDKVSSLIAMFEEGINEIYTIPSVAGQSVGGGQNPNFDKPNGLDNAAKEFMDVIVMCYQKISDDLGINSIREAYSPSPNDGYKLQMASLQQSRNATEYMSTMILSVLKHAASQTLLMCRDIIKYKTTIPYKYMCKAVGIDTVKALEYANVPLNRLGIFVESFNTEIERQEQKQWAQQAYANKEIDYSTLQMLNSIDSYKKAGQMLAYEKKKAEKKALAEQQRQQDYLLQLDQQKTDNVMKVDAQKIFGDIKQEDIKGKWYYEAHKTAADATVQSTELKTHAAAGQIDLKKEAEIEKDRAKDITIDQASMAESKG